MSSAAAEVVVSGDAASTNGATRSRACELVTETVEREGGVSARLAGTADLTAKQRVDEFLAALHQRVLGRAAAEVVVDCRDLEFMSSSCILGLVAWIDVVAQLSTAQRYRIVLRGNLKLRWQRRVFRALSWISPDVVVADR